MARVWPEDNVQRVIVQCRIRRQAAVVAHDRGRGHYGAELPTYESARGELEVFHA